MYNVCTWYNQLSQQVFMVDREMQMQDRGTSLCPLLLWTIWMEAVPVQKMVTFLMPGQMLKIQRRPSTSFLKAWRARKKLVSTGCIHCSASFPFLLPPMAAICRMLRLWRVAFCPGTAEAVYAF
jgi:hypothetical protein